LSKDEEPSVRWAATVAFRSKIVTYPEQLLPIFTNLAKDKNSEYIKPVLMNVQNNSYPISRPLLIYTKGKPQGIVKAFVDFVLSGEGQEIVRKLDFVPIK
jgi:ABC-type phosphate transport system substrate-binding protein